MWFDERERESREKDCLCMREWDTSVPLKASNAVE